MTNKDKTLRRERTRLGKSQNPQQIDYKKMEKKRSVRTEYWKLKKRGAVPGKKTTTKKVEIKEKKPKKESKKKEKEPELEVIEEEPETEEIDEELDELYSYDDDVDDESELDEEIDEIDDDNEAE